MKYLTTAVDTVRKQENRALAAGGDVSAHGCGVRDGVPAVT
jgi:hypothetical protein